MKAHIRFRDRISCTITEGCEATGLGRTKIYEKIASGEIQTCKVGSRTLLIVESLVSMIDAGVSSERAA